MLPVSFLQGNCCRLLWLAGIIRSKCAHGVFQRVSWKEQCRGRARFAGQGAASFPAWCPFTPHTDPLSASPQSRGLSLRRLLGGILLLALVSVCLFAFWKGTLLCLNRLDFFFQSYKFNYPVALSSWQPSEGKHWVYFLNEKLKEIYCFFMLWYSLSGVCHSMGGI